MNLAHIHFIRELLVADYTGKDIPTMQTCSANASCVNPIFKQAAFYESDAVRALYHKLGGGRREGAYSGSTVVIPNRSRWARLWPIAAEQVQVMEHTDASQQTSEQQHFQQEKASARNRMMRD